MEAEPGSEEWQNLEYVEMGGQAGEYIRGGESSQSGVKAEDKNVMHNSWSWGHRKGNGKGRLHGSG